MSGSSLTTVTRTGRGFAVARGFDLYGQPFSIQDSSLAEEACIWLGSDGEEGGRAHLTQADAAALIPLLQAFVSSGSIAATDTRIKTAVGPTILLQSGAYFDLLDPHGSDFTIEDIAHGLSNCCRFAGQCRTFYSVAEHCWHASYVVDPAFALAALMHDAAEAFIGDVTRPLKSLLPEYKAIERNVEAAIQQRFGTGDWNVDEVKHADLLMLRAEQLALMPNDGARWQCLDGVDEAQVADVFLQGFAPAMARAAWLSRYEKLTA